MVNSILFHHFKHHLGYIKTWMSDNTGNSSPETITTIKTLGGSQLDMYCGHLSVDCILEEVSVYLHGEGINDIIEYNQWIDNDFKLCTLSDSSCFTLRFINHEKFVHIHPARHAPHTLRIKANALRALFATCL